MIILSFPIYIITSFIWVFVADRIKAYYDPLISVFLLSIVFTNISSRRSAGVGFFSFNTDFWALLKWHISHVSNLEKLMLSRPIKLWMVWFNINCPLSPSLLCYLCAFNLSDILATPDAAIGRFFDSYSDSAWINRTPPMSLDLAMGVSIPKMLVFIRFSFLLVVTIPWFSLRRTVEIISQDDFGE